MQENIQIHPCFLKLSRKQESVTDGRYYYIPHRYRGGIIANSEDHANGHQQRYSAYQYNHIKVI
jgi:hypothetical protein